MIMKFLNLVIVIWWCIMFVYVSAITKPTSEDRYVLATTQCKARCFTKYLIDRKLGGLQPWSWKPLKCSYNDRDCNLCFDACEDRFFLSGIFDCSELCKSSEYYRSSKIVCLDACNYVYNIIQIGKKSGECPESNKTRASRSTTECLQDWDCGGGSKCCLHERCVNPVFTKVDVPIHLSIKKLETNTLKLNWKMPVSRIPQRLGIYFIIQMRYSSYKEIIQHAEWEFIQQTSSLSKRIEDIQAGLHYQFRVAAISQHGYNGYSEPKEIFIPKSNEKRPSAPRNFQVVELNSINGSKYTQVELSWQIPERIDGRFRKYKLLYYSSYCASLMLYENNEACFDDEGDHKVNIRKTKNKFIVEKLLHGMEYEFKLFAVVSVNHEQLRGFRAKIKYKTKDLPDTAKKKTEVGRSSAEVAEKNEKLKKVITPTSSTELRTKSLVTQRIQHQINAKIINNTENIVSFQWHVFDSNVTSLDVTLYHYDCKDSTKRRYYNHIIPSRINKYTIQYLNRLCYYKLKIIPLYYDSKQGKEVLLKFHTYPLRRKETNSSESLLYHTSHLLLYICLSLVVLSYTL